jgi:hypothetical protein
VTTAAQLAPNQAPTFRVVAMSMPTREDRGRDEPNVMSIDGSSAAAGLIAPEAFRDAGEASARRGARRGISRNGAGRDGRVWTTPRSGLCGCTA